MSDTVKFEAAFTDEDLAWMKTFTPAEKRQVLLEAERKAMGRGGVLVDHWEEGQSTFPAPSPAYEKKKGTSARFYETGRALEALGNSTSPARGRKVSAGKGRISIWLKPAEAAGGRNPYDIAQLGEFGGLKFEGGGKSRFVGKGAAISARRVLKSRFADARGAGETRSFTEWSRGQQSAVSRRPGERMTRVAATVPRMVMRGRPSDRDVLVPVLRNAVGDVIEARLKSGG